MTSTVEETLPNELPFEPTTTTPQCTPAPGTPPRTASTVGTSTHTDTVGTSQSSPPRTHHHHPTTNTNTNTKSHNPFGSLANLSTNFGLYRKNNHKNKSKRIPPPPIHAPNGVINPYNNIGISDGSSVCASISSLGDSTIGDHPKNNNQNGVTTSPSQSLSPPSQSSPGLNEGVISSTTSDSPMNHNHTTHNNTNTNTNISVIDPFTNLGTRGGSSLSITPLSPHEDSDRTISTLGADDEPEDSDLNHHPNTDDTDVPDDATTTTSDSSIHNGSSSGYALPGTMNATPLTLYDVDDDENSIATPIPKALPNLLTDTGLPTNFLRNRSGTYQPGIINDVVSKSGSSSEDPQDYLVSDDRKKLEALRHKREQENVGRLVVKAKQQHNLRMAWFAEAETNALPELPPRRSSKNKSSKMDGSREGRRITKIPSNAPPELKARAMEEQQKKAMEEQRDDGVGGNGNGDGGGGNGGGLLKKGFSGLKIKIPKRTGPIDLDSGAPWGEDEDVDDDAATKPSVPGSFAITTHTGKTAKRSNKFGIQFGHTVPEDEDLTYQTRRKGLDRIVCTIGRSRCSLLAFIVFLIALLAVIAGIVVYVFQKKESTGSSTGGGNDLSVVPSLVPTVSLQPTSMPSDPPTLRPSSFPSSQPSVSSMPTKQWASTDVVQVGDDLVARTQYNNDMFGETVGLSRDGQIVAIGSSVYPDQLGSVTVFQYDENLAGGSWRQLGDIIEGSVAETRFGYRMKLSADGSTVVVGEPFHTKDGDNIGQIHAFRYDESVEEWKPLGNPIEGELGPDTEFGTSVTVSSDGRRLVVGAPDHKTTGIAFVYTYDESTNEWTPYELQGGKNIFDKFGHNVDLSGDGTTLAVSSIVANLKGFVVIYKLNSNDKFEEVTRLIPDTFRLNFGWSISLSWDGSHLAVGSPVGMGRVDVYKQNNSTYAPLGEPFFGTTNNQRLGYSVSLSEDGLKVAIGSPTIFDSKVEIYRFTNGSWGTGIEILAGDTQNGCGWDVDLASNANYIAFGCPNNIFGSGMVYSLD